MFEAKTITKPKIKFETVELQTVGGSRAKFPGAVSWDPITLTMVDGGMDIIAGSEEMDVSRGVTELLNLSGYTGWNSTQTKTEAFNAIGPLTIQQIDARGRPIEEWVLINPFITSVDYGELDYSSEEFTKITLEIAYDKAEVSYFNSNGTPTTYLK